MIETVLRSYLLGQLTNVPVYAEIPADPPETFILIEKTGSSRSNLIESATIAVQSYASSMYNAAALNQTVKAAMFAAPGTVPQISAVYLDSDYNFTDTDTKHYRYQAVFEITHYEV